MPPIFFKTATRSKTNLHVKKTIEGDCCQLLCYSLPVLIVCTVAHGAVTSLRLTGMRLSMIATCMKKYI